VDSEQALLGVRDIRYVITGMGFYDRSDARAILDRLQFVNGHEIKMLREEEEK
jgi:hypothetical protein